MTDTLKDSILNGFEEDRSKRLNELVSTALMADEINGGDK